MNDPTSPAACLLLLNSNEWCMKDLHTLNHSELIDLLNQQTYEYTKMLRLGTSQQQYESSKLYINNIIAEIEKRKKANVRTSPSGNE
jgi:hypothetical protein